METLDQNLISSLKKTGLSSKECLIYGTLVALGGAYPSKIAEISKLNRTTVYKILEKMAVQGLVAEVEKGKKIYYQIEAPKNLEQFLNSQVTLAKRRVEQSQSLMPILEGLYKNMNNKPVVRFYEGPSGVLSVYQDHVAGTQSYEMLAFSNTGDLMEFLSEDFRTQYIRKKQRYNIRTRAILPDTQSDIKYNETIYGQFSKKIWPELRHIPHAMFPYKSDLTIYGKNKVSIINFNEPKVAGLIIEDHVIHDMMAMIFELSWKGATKK
jgi:sugar-specific transcriptional regulator TrmB